MSDERFSILAEQSRCAVKCTYCFSNARVGHWQHVPKRPANRPDDVAAVPYVGTQYWDRSPRVAVMMLNPGGAAADHKLARRDAGLALGKGEIDYACYNETMATLLPKWGFGRVLQWINAVGFSADEIAFLNMALCAVERDAYFPELFEACFAQNTRHMLITLKPSVLLLCGRKQLSALVPMIEDLGIKTILTWHYRPMHTTPGKAEIQRVRDLLDQIQ